MADVPPTYRRLPGRGTTLASYVRLYEGPDHLLQITSTGYSESYKRFFYRDIQALIIRRNRWFEYFAAGLGALTLLVALPATLAFANNRESAIVLFFVGGIFLALLLGHWLLGPTCVCEIQTAVQTERLFGLSRVRRAQKFLGRLKPLIDAAQGPLTPADLSAQLSEAWRAAAFEATHPSAETS
jgi:hypothetical protein